jgi:N-acetylglucosamine kinase-like BadF-type ATPase
MLSLGIDGGSSSAKWTLIDQTGAIKSKGSSNPIDGHLYRVESQEKMEKFLLELRQELGNLNPDRITIGITGLGSIKKIEEYFLKAFPGAKLSIGTDVALAYRSEFKDGEGIYLYAGTGSIAVHITKTGEEISIGGWGYLLGDEGAGYWIGREALRHLMTQIEELSSLDELSTSISQAVGGKDWPSIRQFVYSKDRSAIAGLTPIVANCASNGSKSAVAILDNAANYLAELALRMEARLKSVNMPIAFGGGIASPALGIGQAIKSKLGRDIQINSHDHSLTAAKLGLN